MVDASAILELQRLAYRSEAKIYEDDTIAPLTQSLEEVKADFSAKTVLKATAQGCLLGSVRGFQKGQTCYIERLMVHPEFQGKGLGTALMRHAEKQFPGAGRYELFTGHKSERNIHLYQKLGYSIFKRERISERLTFLYMEKRL